MKFRWATLMLACAGMWAQEPGLTPEALNKRLQAGERPHLYHVGFGVLYRNKHIAHSEFAGPGSKPEGLVALKKAVAGLKKDEPILIYCGCCPWDKCPNMRPAYQALEGMGFKHIQMLSIPTNLAKDWIDKGYATEAGSAAQ